MNENTDRRTQIFLLIGAGLVAAGCSLIGLGVGAIVDKKPRHQIPGWEIQAIEPGQKVELTLADGHVMKGKFTGLSPVPDTEYRRRYDEARVALRGVTDDAVDLPRLGVGATIVDASGNRAECEYLGFELGAIAFYLPNRADVSTLPFERLHTLADADGRRVDGATLRRLVHERKVPMRADVTIDNAGRVRIEEIAQLSISKGKGKMIGFLGGLAIDAIIVIVALSDNGSESPPPESDHPQNSCPFIYGFDGERYRLEGEIFGGAIFEAAQRTSWDRLDHPRLIDGRYRIKVTNELQETQFVDELKLIAVDHAPGVEVLPSATGQLHTLSRPRPPLSAIDSLNHDVTRLLSRRDGDVWLDNPFVRTADSGDVRSAVELVFTRPAFARRATLVFSVRNTLWASYLRRGTLEVFGRDLDRWYALMNTSAEARGRFHDAVDSRGDAAGRGLGRRGVERCRLRVGGRPGHDDATAGDSRCSVRGVADAASPLELRAGALDGGRSLDRLFGAHGNAQHRGGRAAGSRSSRSGRARSPGVWRRAAVRHADDERLGRRRFSGSAAPSRSGAHADPQELGVLHHPHRRQG